MDFNQVKPTILRISEVQSILVNSEVEIIQMVFRPENMPHVIDHMKNIDSPDSYHKRSRIDLVIC